MILRENKGKYSTPATIPISLYVHLDTLKTNLEDNLDELLKRELTLSMKDLYIHMIYMANKCRMKLTR